MWCNATRSMAASAFLVLRSGERAFLQGIYWMHSKVSSVVHADCRRHKELMYVVVMTGQHGLVQLGNRWRPLPPSFARFDFWFRTRVQFHLPFDRLASPSLPLSADAAAPLLPAIAPSVANGFKPQGLGRPIPSRPEVHSFLIDVNCCNICNILKSF